MSPDDHSTSDGVSTDDDLSRRTTLKGMAALGASATFLGAAAGSASAHPTPHEIVVERHSERVEYRIEVSGEIEKGSKAGWNDEVHHDGTVVVGELDADLKDDIDDAVDDYRFSGEVVDIDVMKGKAKFTIKRTDEKTVTKKKKKEKKKTDDEDEKQSHEVSIHAEGPHVDYEFVVTGDVEPGDEADIGVGDQIDGDVVTGDVAGSGVDNYHYTGEIEKFHVTDSDEVTVKLDGEEVDPDDVGDWGYVVIHAQGPHVKYEFETSGEFEPASEAEMGVGSFIDDGRAYGNVAGSHGRDNYWFTGELTRVATASDEVTVRVNGEEVHPDDL